MPRKTYISNNSAFWVNCSCFLSSAFFFKIYFFKNYFKNTISVEQFGLRSGPKFYPNSKQVWLGNAAITDYRSTGHFKLDKTKVLTANGSLMKVESIAECSLDHSTILLTCMKLLSVLKNNFQSSFWEAI